MDAFMVDVTEISHVKENAEVILIGSQGKERITAQDIADKVGSIPYEVLTSIGERVKRIYRTLWNTNEGEKVGSLYSVQSRKPTLKNSIGYHNDFSLKSSGYVC